MSLSTLFKIRPDIRVDFNDGPCVEICSEAPTHRVEMRVNRTVIHQTEIEGKQWTRANRKYYSEWSLEIFRKNRSVYKHRFSLEKRRVRVNIDSKSLGDTLAWVPQVQAFARKHPTSTVFVSQFWHDLFDQSAYPELTFIEPESVVEDCYATYNIGYYFDNPEHYHPTDLRTVPLGKVASDILGIEFSEIRPTLVNSITVAKTTQKPYVCIATASTAECKHWLYPDGWQQVIDYLKAAGYETMVIQKEKSKLNRIIDESGDKAISDRISQLENCAFFIGLGSGLSWLAWAVGKPVVLISGFSEPYAEFTLNCERVLNVNVCHGCWNDPSFRFDRNDWHWCPRHKNTERQFECSTSIHPQQVTDAVDSILQRRSLT